MILTALLTTLSVLAYIAIAWWLIGSISHGNVGILEFVAGALWPVTFVLGLVLYLGSFLFYGWED